MAVDEVTSVYVGGLPYEANEDMLRDAFEYYGTIVAVKVRSLPPFSLVPAVLPGGLGHGHGSDAVICNYVFWKSEENLFDFRVYPAAIAAFNSAIATVSGKKKCFPPRGCSIVWDGQMLPHGAAGYL